MEIQFWRIIIARKNTAWCFSGIKNIEFQDFKKNETRGFAKTRMRICYHNNAWFIKKQKIEFSSEFVVSEKRRPAYENQEVAESFLSRNFLVFNLESIYC